MVRTYSCTNGAKGFGDLAAVEILCLVSSGNLTMRKSWKPKETGSKFESVSRDSDP
jgi:hypothetical protein